MPTRPGRDGLTSRGTLHRAAPAPPLPSPTPIDRSRTIREAFSSAAGPVTILPDEVVRPRSAEDVRALLPWAAAEGIPLVPRGAGTGMPGGNVGEGLVATPFIEDSVVPVDRLPGYLAGVGGILDDAGSHAVMFGHAGDGNVHVNPLIDRSLPGWKQRARTVLARTAELVRDLGGTLAGEHGDGRILAPHLETVWGSDMVRAFEDTKRAMDPGEVLNPGVVIPLPGQDPLAGVG